MKVKQTVIKNIYYMLTYAFRVLRQKNYDKVASESFDHIYDLFATILVKGVNKQVKQGLYKEYVVHQDNLSTVRGKINIRDTISNKLQRKQLIACEYDELTENNLLNQIIKTTILLLLSEESVKDQSKIHLKRLLLHFSEVSMINPKEISWHSIQYQKNNETYEMLMNICYFIIDNLLLTTAQGSYKSPMFSEENMNLLFERFVLNYYKEHYKDINVYAPYIKWNIDQESDQLDEVYLPRMETDIVLETNNKSLIIDTKFYSEPMTKNDKLQSHNLYQIFSYVKNMDTRGTGTVSGMLLYAQTERDIYPDFMYRLDGNLISARTLNLNQNFEAIKEQLNRIVEEKLLN